MSTHTKLRYSLHAMHRVSHPSPFSHGSCDIPMQCSATSGLPCLWGPGDSGWAPNTAMFYSYLGTLPDGNSGLILARWPPPSWGMTFDSYDDDELILKNNGVQALDNSIFAGMPLKKVDISGNNLMELPTDLCERLVSLESFNASDNALQTLPSGFFRNQSALLELYLHTNFITCLPSDIFRPLMNLTRLEIHGNPDLECGGCVCTLLFRASPSMTRF